MVIHILQKKASDYFLKGAIVGVGLLGLERNIFSDDSKKLFLKIKKEGLEENLILIIVIIIQKFLRKMYQKEQKLGNKLVCKLFLKIK